jgi:hypothetical protein
VRTALTTRASHDPATHLPIARTRGWCRWSCYSSGDVVMNMDDDTAGQHIVWQSPLSDDGWTDKEPPVNCAISAPVPPPRRRFGRRFGRVPSSISRSSGRRQPRSGERHRIVLNDEPTLRRPSRSRASSGRRSRMGPPDRRGQLSTDPARWMPLQCGTAHPQLRHQVAISRSSSHRTQLSSCPSRLRRPCSVITQGRSTYGGSWRTC